MLPREESFTSNVATKYYPNPLFISMEIYIYHNTLTHIHVYIVVYRSVNVGLSNSLLHLVKDVCPLIYTSLK